MTRRFSISLPDDLAAQLDRVENASAYIAECMRLRRRRDTVRKVLADAGYEITEEGIERMRQRVHELERRRRARRLEEIRRGRAAS
jgi:metal-responsive CopG/Arc/MetJ family transcriptional regulator